MTPPVIHTSRTLLSLPNNSDAEILFRYYLDNRTHLQPWEPTQTGSFFTLESFETKIKERCLHFANGTAINFVATDIARTEVIAVCNFTNIVRGTFQGKSVV